MPKQKPLSVGVPSTFAAQVGPTFPAVTGDPLPEVHGMDGTWVRLKDGSLPVPVTARIDQTPDGRLIVTGMVIGLGQREEITSETLREIRLARVLAELFDGFDPMNPARDALDNDRGQSLFALWQMHRRELPEVEIKAKPRRHAAPDLRQVAEVYLRHLAATPRRATTATSEELHCSRATVIRRVTEARKAGLLPSTV